LPTLVPSLTYEVLVPFLGEDAAKAAAFAETPHAGRLPGEVRGG
jgi:hypothetical protein